MQGIFAGAGLRLYLSALHQSIEIMLLGLDIGSSSVKAALVDDRSGKTIAMAMAPATEMKIDSPFPGGPNRILYRGGIIPLRLFSN